MAPGADGIRTAVTDCVGRIGAGKLFQANLYLRLDGRFGGSAADAAAVRRPAYGAFIGSLAKALLSFSPSCSAPLRPRVWSRTPACGTSSHASEHDCPPTSLTTTCCGRPSRRASSRAQRCDR
jgi:anthranilate/para-aminobenzoate synthase component I